jgi:hypothetical protein
MKVYTNFKLSKGYEHWKAGFDDLGPEMRAVGMKVIYRACEADNENKVHMILEMPSIETAKKLMRNPEIQQKRVEAGVIIDSQVIIPLAD